MSRHYMREVSRHYMREERNKAQDRWLSETLADGEWRPCPGFSDYMVSSGGRVIRIVRKPGGPVRELKPASAGSGYLFVVLGNGIPPQKQRYVHRIVCEAFHGPKPSPMHIVAHNDGDKTNNRADNLRWATQSENLSDRVAHGTMTAGEQQGMSKLTWDAVDQMRREFCGRRGQIAEFQRRYGVATATVLRVLHKKGWKPEHRPGQGKTA